VIYSGEAAFLDESGLDRKHPRRATTGMLVFRPANDDRRVGWWHRAEARQTAQAETRARIDLHRSHSYA